jgi:molybdopterin-guanine dinucleotide biosynthesis protein A
MGRDKAFLDYYGTTLWSFQLEKLASFASEILISSQATFPDHPSIEFSVVADVVPGLGPLGGLGSALMKARHDTLAVLAVDMPKMNQRFLAGIAAEATSDCGIVPEWEGFYQGLAAVYPKKILPLLAQVLGGSNHSLQYLNRLAVEKGVMRVHQVEGNEGGFFQNWNTPGDVEFKHDGCRE